jgi:hypothetical protein
LDRRRENSMMRENAKESMIVCAREKERGRYRDRESERDGIRKLRIRIVYIVLNPGTKTKWQMLIIILKVGLKSGSFSANVCSLIDVVLTLESEVNTTKRMGLNSSDKTFGCKCSQSFGYATSFHSC